MKPIAIFWHGLFQIGDQPLPMAIQILIEQMDQLELSGLYSEASHLVFGVNGGPEALRLCKGFIPPKFKIVLHGLESRAENLTIVEIEKWVPDHPGWYVLYGHMKNASRQEPHPINTPWRRCMMKHCVTNWRQCVADLDAGAEAVGCHWMTGMADGTQNIFAGNFWWATSNFLRTVPSIYDRARIKQSGIAALESRYESEVWLGNGPRLPIVKDYHPANPCLSPCP